MALNIGIDLCDDYITAYNYEEKSMLSVPAVICREKNSDHWYIGETAYRNALSGKGVLTDKLISLFRKNGTSTVSGNAYTAEQLIAKLMGIVLMQILNGAALSEIDSLVIALSTADRELMDMVSRAAEVSGVGAEGITVISHQEAFIHYVLAQEKELSYNMVGLFDLSGDSLAYYRLRIIRGGSRKSVIAEGEDLEEAFRIGILKNESGSELGDRIMTDTARKCMGTDIYSSVFLTGKGFERTDWAKNFIAFICRKRRVIFEDGLFAIGSAIYAYKLSGHIDSGYMLLCDTRLKASLSIDVLVNERKSRLIMLQAGEPWYGAYAYAEVLPRGQDCIYIDIDPVDRSADRKNISIGMEDFPDRPERCTRLSLELSSITGERISARIKDLGFGDIYPAAGTVIERDITI